MPELVRRLWTVHHSCADVIGGGVDALEIGKVLNPILCRVECGIAIVGKARLRHDLDVGELGTNPIGLKWSSRIGPRKKLSGRDDVNDEVKHRCEIMGAVLVGVDSGKDKH